MRTRPTSRRMRGLLVAAGLGATLAISGCGVLDRGVYDTPLPGGADIGSDPIKLTAEFEDVLDLVPQSSVKVDNVAVGRVSKISLSPDGRTATVELLVNDDTDLPEGTTARLQQTSLLGEKYVALVRPDAADAGDAQLASGSVIEREDTDQAAQVEQVLGALSLVLNGGEIEKFQTISRELQDISADDPERVRTFLTQLEGFVTTVDGRRDDIAATLDSLAALSTTLEGDTAQIENALDNLAPGLQVMAEQRPQFVAMLESLDSLSAIAVQTLDAAQQDIIADLQLLDPVLTQLAASGQDLPNALQILLTYPFPDSVLGTIRGDYMNVFVTTNFRTLPTDCAAIGCFWPQIGSGEPPLTGGGAAPGLLPPTDSVAPGLPAPTMSVPVSPGPNDTPPPNLPGAPPTKLPPATPPASPGTPPGAPPTSLPNTSEDGE